LSTARTWMGELTSGEGDSGDAEAVLAGDCILLGDASGERTEREGVAAAGSKKATPAELLFGDVAAVACFDGGVACAGDTAAEAFFGEAAEIPAAFFGEAAGLIGLVHKPTPGGGGEAISYDDFGLVRPPLEGGDFAAVGEAGVNGGEAGKNEAASACCCWCCCCCLVPTVLNLARVASDAPC
jgi:hypothetical protein